MPFSTAIKNALLDSLPTITHVSAHEGLPDDNGSNEIFGSRTPASFLSASAGKRVSATSPVMAVDQGSIVTYIGFWSSSIFIGSVRVAAAEFGGNGTYTLTNATISL